MNTVSILSIVGSLVWVVALSVMAGVSRTGFNQIPKGVPVPMLWDAKRTVLWRAPRTLGLVLLPTVAFLGGIVLLYLAVASPNLVDAVVWLGVRVLLAGLIALAHLTHVRRAIQTLGAEGRLVP